MAGSSDKAVLGASLWASTLLHTAGAVSLALWSVRGEGASARVESRAEADELVEFVLPPAEPEPEPIRLGLEGSSAVSEAWLGAEQAQEHVAQPSLVDQPELTLDPPAGLLDALAAAMASPRERTPSSVESPAAIQAGSEAVGEAMQAPLEDEPADEPMADTAAPESQLLQPPERASEPALSPAAPAGGAGEAGTQSDRESSAASIMTADWRKLGQPLAGGGLEIRTRRPRFTQYTRLMGARRDPVFRVHFRKDGRVERVETVETSGNPDVDRPVIDAIYQWRAAGEPLVRLKEPSPPALVALEFRILL